MVSYGDDIDVHDWGICKLVEIVSKDTVTIFLVEEGDGSINWYVNPDFNSDTILVQRNVEFVRNR